MLKEVIRAIDTGMLPFIGLIAFAVAFVSIVVWAMTMKKEDREAAKQQPLRESKEVFVQNQNGYGN